MTAKDINNIVEDIAHDVKINALLLKLGKQIENKMKVALEKHGVKMWKKVSPKVRAQTMEGSMLLELLASRFRLYSWIAHTPKAKT